MNKVSWRRILQRAGHEFPNEGGAVIQMREGSQTRENPQESWGGYKPPHPPREARQPSEARHPSEARPGVLESELKRALDRASRREHESKAIGTPPGWEPIFMAQEVSGKAPPPALRAKVEGAAPKRAGTGSRNILAISLSAAVVGLAFHQIGSQWNESRTSVSAVPEATANSASMLYSSGEMDDSQAGYGVQPRAAVEPQSLPVRQARTEEAAPQRGAGTTKEREAFLKEIEQAASLIATQPKAEDVSRTPVSAPLRDPAPSTSIRETAPTPKETVGISGADEQSMLRRARELMERGHITGARLIFEHLALQQSALGAFALAQTYDERFLKTFFVKGMQPDPALAAKWYRRAAEIGSQFAGRQ